MISLVSKIAKNLSYQITSKVIGTILGLLSVGIMTRYLGQTGYGYYTSAIAFLQFFSVLADFGLQMTTTQLISKPLNNEKEIFKNIFTIRLLSSIIFIGISILVGWLSPYPLIIKQGITIAGLGFAFIHLQTVFVSIFQHHMDMKAVAFGEISGRLALLGGVWLTAANNFSLHYMIWAVAFGAIVNVGVLWRCATKYIKVRLAFDFSIWKKIWKTTWPLAITIALTLVYFRADTIVMSYARPQNEVGLYGATYKVLEILIQLPYLFLGLMLPLLTKFFLINKKLFETIIQKSFDFLIILSIPIIVATLVLGEKIMVFVAGNDFLISGNILRVLIFAVGLIFVGALFGYILVACELQKKMIKFYIIDALISIPLYLYFIPKYSYWAAAILTIFTEAIITFSAYYLIRTQLKIKLKFKVFQKALLASLIMALPIVLFIQLHILWLIVIGILVYFWVLYKLKGFDKKTIIEAINYKRLN
jgi:O-antigen/teichoic acid export membrane protein